MALISSGQRILAAEIGRDVESKLALVSLPSTIAMTGGGGVPSQKPASVYVPEACHRLANRFVKLVSRP